MNMNKHYFSYLLSFGLCIFPLYMEANEDTDSVSSVFDGDVSAVTDQFASGFRDISLSPDERAELLLKELTLEEKIYP